MRNRLREIRSNQSWSQAELARRLGVSRQTVNALERGKYDPSLPLAFRIARLFDSPIEDIFLAEGEIALRRQPGNGGVAQVHAGVLEAAGVA